MSEDAQAWIAGNDPECWTTELIRGGKCVGAVALEGNGYVAWDQTGDWDSEIFGDGESELAAAKAWVEQRTARSQEAQP